MEKTVYVLRVKNNGAIGFKKNSQDKIKEGLKKLGFCLESFDFFNQTFFDPVQWKQFSFEIDEIEII